MKKEFAELPGWTFDIQETSMGVYKITGRDRSGRSVVKSGTEPELDEMLDECKKYAMSFVDAQAKSKGD